MDRVIIGTWAFGDSYWGEQKHSDTLKTIHASLRNGFNTFDTAPIYGNGKSEQVLGQQLKGSEDVFINTKVLCKPISAVKKSIDNSLKRLNRTELNCCFIHWPSTKFEVTPVLEYLKTLKSDGVIKKIGLSNFSLKELQSLNENGDIDIVQNAFNYLWPWDKNLFTYCKNSNIETQAYSPLAQGLLTGKYTNRHPYIIKDKRTHMVLYKEEQLLEVYEIIEDLLPLTVIEETSLSRIILKWTLDQPYIDSIIVGCRDRKQLENLIGLEDLNLKESSTQRLNQVQETVKGRIKQYNNIFNHSY